MRRCDQAMRHSVETCMALRANAVTGAHAAWQAHAAPESLACVQAVTLCRGPAGPAAHLPGGSPSPGHAALGPAAGG